jgi:hypothetical protein
MRVQLMHREHDFDPKQPLPPNAATLVQDLELNTLLQAMAGGDEFLLGTARAALLLGSHNDVATVLYRQAVARDCLQNPAVVRRLYDITVAALESKRKSSLGIFSDYPAAILRGSIELLKLFAGVLLQLRGIAETQAHRFESEGFTALFAMLQSEFDDAYLARIHAHLDTLKHPGGVLVSAGLGAGNGGDGYVLRQLPAGRPNWLARLLGKAPPEYSFRIADRDQAGATALSELQDRGIHLVANALAQSADHMAAFFEMLRTELAFYLGALNLHDRLTAKGEAISFPVPAPAGERKLSFDGLVDVCLTLSTGGPVVSNAVSADGKRLVVITGANQGGKSSFLRSVGLAQLMMQCGLFVCARSFAANTCSGLFTHHKREEDKSLKSGKFDEELSRMSEIVGALATDGMVLFNESFAATNEREGSEIARQIVRALLDKRIKVFFVTHMFDFARGLFDAHMPDAMFLRADRQPDGTRSFRLVQGEPLATSFGDDLYAKIFGTADRAAPVADAGRAA